ncbi:GDSL esterase/lipase At5g55050-like [Cryptomeria japonica]|uniref:GDSL esterase/lipase At5g55050-like n=1 Tax=Cryptomeria japonica TaxID=3369 RepID=UPI0027DA59F2|nr:GDSL esterase/lipase At5g55050-like [Cryptomeria japonica]
MAIIERSMLGIFVGLSMISFLAGAEKGGYVPAMFVFGDSLGDAGNNNYIPNSKARANFTPYGVSFFHYPTGRFTNGRTAFDFLATYLRLPFAPPYLKPKANFKKGINFASGGSGLLDSTGAGGNIITMSRQIFQFQHTSYILRKTHPSGAKKAKSYISKSLYCITIGGNDIADYIANSTLQNTTTPQQFVTLLLSKFDQYMAGLYRAGARKFLVVDVPVLGCTPFTRLSGYSIAKGECLESVNQLVVAYNTALKTLMAQLREKLDGVTIIQLKTYDYFMNIIQNAEAYGFKNTNTACCGSGLFNADVNCGKTTPQNLFCNDTNAYMFWDKTHPTEKVHAMFSHQIWSGNSSFIQPINLSTLVLKTNASGY